MTKSFKYSGLYWNGFIHGEANCTTQDHSTRIRYENVYTSYEPCHLPAVPTSVTSRRRIHIYETAGSDGMHTHLVANHTFSRTFQHSASANLHRLIVFRDKSTS
ncbi:hypothetical protein C0J52_13726 [Blattella germanica]|nr:hypothetical protein C0J52_13726 [Blattella germanica]